MLAQSSTVFHDPLGGKWAPQTSGSRKIMLHSQLEYGILGSQIPKMMVCDAERQEQQS